MTGASRIAQEHCLRIGPAAPINSAAPTGQPAILLIPPLFDEANRMRRTLVLMMRALADLGYNTLLPDLPGQNDSLVPTARVTLTHWRNALAEFGAAHGGPYITASWRGGALLDHAIPHCVGHWRMAPQSGASIVKMMMRVRIAGEKEAGRSISSDTLRAQALTGPLELAGHSLSGTMLAELEESTPAAVTPLRSMMVGAGEGQLPGTALWLRAEPGEDAAMALAMAQDIAAWSLQCAAG